MQASKWEFVSLIGSDPITLEFKKDNERARLLIQSSGSSRTALSIQISEDSSLVGSGETKLK